MNEKQWFAGLLSLTLAAGEPFVSVMFGAGLHGIARLAAEPAHGERHRFALN